MRRSKRFLFLAAGILPVLLVVALCLMVWRRSGNEPRYQGKALSDWLDDAAYADASSLARGKARAAIQEIGTNALPHLLNLLEAPYTDTDGSLIQWIKNQSWLPDRARDRMGDQSLHRWKQAAEGFSALGTNAAPATPRLIHLAGIQIHGGGLGTAGLYPLEMIGTAAVEPLILSLTNSDRTEAGVQAMKLGAVYGLRMLKIERAVPNLLRCFNDADAKVREEAIYTLALIQPPRATVIERLTQALHDPELAVSRAAVRALGGFGSSATNAVPVMRQLRRASPLRPELDEAIAKITNSRPAP